MPDAGALNAPTRPFRNTFADRRTKLMNSFVNHGAMERHPTESDGRRTARHSNGRARIYSIALVLVLMTCAARPGLSTASAGDFNLAIQDDKTGARALVNIATGEYLFVDARGRSSLSGR